MLRLNSAWLREHCTRALLGLMLAVSIASIAAETHPFGPGSRGRVPVRACAACIRANMNFLASDALRGRGSGTPDELLAAVYIASELQRAGIGPAGDNPHLPGPDAYLQQVNINSGDSALHTRNVIGILPGRNPQLRDQAILLSAHLDHLGVGTAVNGDAIYNGADDDASGVSAVLELARALGGGPRPSRTVIFALFGSEEKGLLGATYYREHPVVPLDHMVANLEFEMIARRDPAIAPDALWLTGWERTTLGPELARHGARLLQDPHPEQHFFRRSDNYALALRGVIAQTVSSFGLHQDYHRPSDDLSRVDWKHLIDAIGSLIGPVRWLANSSFRPRWLPGKRPTETQNP